MVMEQYFLNQISVIDLRIRKGERMSLYTKIIDRQKLDAGWQKVMKNKPAAGVDGVTCDMFQENKKIGRAHV